MPVPPKNVGGRGGRMNEYMWQESDKKAYGFARHLMRFVNLVTCAEG